MTKSKSIMEAIDLTSWGFGLDLEDLVGKQVTEALNRAFEEDPPEFELSVDDEKHVIVWVVLPLGRDFESPVGFSQSLETIVDDLIARDGEDVECISTIITDLQRQIDKLKAKNDVNCGLIGVSLK